MKTFALVGALALALPGPVIAQQAFPTPDAAADALVQALSTPSPDQARLTRLLGPNWHDYIPVGSVDRADVDAFLAGYRARHSIQTGANGRAILAVGTSGWTLPVPIVKRPAGWAFDVAAGADDIRARRIGRNELDALASVRTYDDAQMEYAATDHDGDGVLEYAQTLLSTDGQHDGLYWADDASGEISPLGPLFGDATPGGDWHGYHFRILTAQGPSAPGGAYTYMIGKNMVRGFALIAWPARYDDSGVMSFMISHDGVVFQKNLGPDTDATARAMKVFDPDDSWTEVPASTGAP